MSLLSRRNETAADQLKAGTLVRCAASPESPPYFRLSGRLRACSPLVVAPSRPGAGGLHAYFFDRDILRCCCWLRDDHQGDHSNRCGRYAWCGGRNLHHPDSERAAGRDDSWQRRPRQGIIAFADYMHEGVLRRGVEHHPLGY